MGIHAGATTFAFIHPPADLGDQIIWSEFEVNQSVVKDGPNTWAMPYVAMIGGYAYFDNEDELV